MPLYISDDIYGSDPADMKAAASRCIDALQKMAGPLPGRFEVSITFVQDKDGPPRWVEAAPNVVEATVEMKPVRVTAKEFEETAAAFDAAEPGLLRDEIVSLGNRLGARHPRRNEALRDVLGRYGGTRLSDIAETDYPALRASLVEALAACGGRP
jgi:hypothetical protein